MMKHLFLTLLLSLLPTVAFAADSTPIPQTSAQQSEAPKQAAPVAEEPRDGSTPIIIQIPRERKELPPKATRTEWPKGKLSRVQCKAFENEIRDDMAAANTCLVDDDCQLENYGCPWQQGICHMTLTGKDDGDLRAKVYGKIDHWNKSCLEQDEPLKEKCKIYYEMTQDADCKRVDIELMCVNGQCVTQTHFMTNHGDGVDVFGSRRAVGVENR